MRGSLETGFDAIMSATTRLRTGTILGSGFRLMLTEIRRRHIRLPGLGWRLGLTRRELAAMSGLGSKKLGRALREGELPELLRLAITDQLRIPTRYS